jgi:hypothetical protein
MLYESSASPVSRSPRFWSWEIEPSNETMQGVMRGRRAILFSPSGVRLIAGAKAKEQDARGVPGKSDYAIFCQMVCSPAIVMPVN